MRIILSVAVSLDGYIDDTTAVRLKLSSPEDWERVVRLRGECDAILVGAGTVRSDNPSLVIRDDGVRAEREARGQDRNIIKVAVTSSGRLDPAAKFFTEGGGRKYVFASGSADGDALKRITPLAEVITADKITASLIETELAARGVSSLMVEGGSHIHTMFLTEGVFDELRYAVAPFFVGDGRAPRFTGGGLFSHNKDNRLRLAGVEMAGDMAVMRYVNGRREDERYLRMAIDESRKCVPTDRAYSVGAVIVTADRELFTGYTHETGAHNHAEEEAVAKATAAGANLRGAVIYSSMEPCSVRASKPKSCTQIIMEHGFARVVYAFAEPMNFADCRGDETLRQAGVEVEVIGGYACDVEKINAHILG